MKSKLKCEYCPSTFWNEHQLNEHYFKQHHVARGHVLAEIKAKFPVRKIVGRYPKSPPPL